MQDAGPHLFALEAGVSEKDVLGYPAGEGVEVDGRVGAGKVIAAHDFEVGLFKERGPGVLAGAGGGAHESAVRVGGEAVVDGDAAGYAVEEEAYVVSAVGTGQDAGARGVFGVFRVEGGGGELGAPAIVVLGGDLEGGDKAAVGDNVLHNVVASQGGGKG